MEKWSIDENNVIRYVGVLDDVPFKHCSKKDLAGLQPFFYQEPEGTFNYKAYLQGEKGRMWFTGDEPIHVAIHYHVFHMTCVQSYPHLPDAMHRIAFQVNGEFIQKQLQEQTRGKRANMVETFDAIARDAFGRRFIIVTGKYFEKEES